MSRILEFQPTDEQTVVARVLVELHQAIDVNFPGANPTARQFSKTVLTHQSESTRVDNLLPGKQGSPFPLNQKQESDDPIESRQLSLTPITNKPSGKVMPTMHTAEMRVLLGDSHVSRGLKVILTLLLLVGVGVFIWLIFLRPETVNTLE